MTNTISNNHHNLTQDHAGDVVGMFYQNDQGLVGFILEEMEDVHWLAEVEKAQRADQIRRVS